MSSVKFYDIISYMPRKILFLLVAILILNSGVWYYFFSYSKEIKGILTLDRLPKDVVFVEHIEDKKLAKEKGGIALRHFATPEASRVGGPIFGVLGYRIVSVEYEIPVSSIGQQLVGGVSRGQSLAIEALKDSLPLPYDHFHIAISSRKHFAGEIQESGEDVYLIHFMFIPHEEELEYGLVCG